MTRFKRVDHFLMMTIIALFVEVGICVAYWQGMVTIIGLITAHLGLIWVLAINSGNPEQKTKLTRRHKAQIALTTLLGPIGPLLIIIWLGVVWLQSTVAIRLFGTEPIFKTIDASNTVIEAYRQAEEERADQLKTANDLLFGDRRQIAQALRCLSERNDDLFKSQIQDHLKGGDASLSALAGHVQKRIEGTLAGNDNSSNTPTRIIRDRTKEQRLERARELLKKHAKWLRSGNVRVSDEDERDANLVSLLDCLFQLGEYEAVRHLLSQDNSTAQMGQHTDLSKYRAFWQF